jgi:hypothetical protein
MGDTIVNGRNAYGTDEGTGRQERKPLFSHAVTDDETIVFGFKMGYERQLASPGRPSSQFELVLTFPLRGKDDAGCALVP